MSKKELPLSFMKQLALNFITLIFGSLIFSGVIENYKSEESIKIMQLEKYFIPARESSNSCLKIQNELYLLYPKYFASLRLLYTELDHLNKNPGLEKNDGYGVLFQGLVKGLEDSQKAMTDLPDKVSACRERVFLQLENLAIATGSFQEFSKASDIRSKNLNDIDKALREKLGKNVTILNTDDPIQMYRKIAVASSGSEANLKKTIIETGEKLPFIEAYSIAMADAEQEKYKIEFEFFSKIRELSASHINKRFKQGFFSWLF